MTPSNVEWFDAAAMIGAHFSPRQGKFFTVPDLRQEMDDFGIVEALVCHGLARDYDLAVGNEALVTEIADQPRLHSCWIVGVPYLSHGPDPRTWLTHALARKVKAVRLFLGGFLSDTAIIDSLTHRTLLEALAEHRMPLLVEYENAHKITAEQVIALDKILEPFPDLPVVLACPVFGLELRLLCARLEKYPNLHLTTFGIIGNGVIETLVQRYGPHRLIFGTNFPWYAPLQTQMALLYADISDDARRAIAGENLRALIGGIKS